MCYLYTIINRSIFTVDMKFQPLYHHNQPFSNNMFTVDL
jgi:hypothetical protein